tara:strand:- start:1013 stop:1420 length:408 start_codon:yes stop_codon:yes gene_type:complete
MTCILPYDIQRFIAQYINDIDVRRFYKIYNNIQIKKWKFLENVIRIPLSNYSNRHFIKFNFIKNYEDKAIRSTENIDNDMLYFNCNIINEIVNLELNIFKLKKYKFDSFKKDIYYKGSLEDSHYWENVKIKYSIN